MLHPLLTKKSSSISVSETSHAMSYSERSHSALNRGSPQGMKSRSIPISNGHFRRTESEMQLCLDEHIADQRDFAFFSRLVDGIQQSQAHGTNLYLQMQNQSCLKHIHQTRSDSRSEFTSTTASLSVIPPFEESSIGLSIDDSQDHAGANAGFFSLDESENTIPGTLDHAEYNAISDGMVFDLDL